MHASISAPVTMKSFSTRVAIGTGTPPASITSAVYATNDGCGTITSSPVSRIEVKIRYIASLTPTVIRISSSGP